MTRKRRYGRGRRARLPDNLFERRLVHRGQHHRDRGDSGILQRADAGDWELTGVSTPRGIIRPSHIGMIRDLVTGPCIAELRVIVYGREEIQTRVRR
jgi:hypothetical protein